jgi:hypothetical protein
MFYSVKLVELEAIELDEDGLLEGPGIGGVIVSG